MNLNFQEIKYILKKILNNQTDVSVPFRSNRIAWHNGMFFSKRAFDLIVEVPKFIHRHRYEVGLFNNTNIRIIGIIKDNQSRLTLRNEMYKHLKYLNKINSINDFNKKLIYFCLIVIIKLIKSEKKFSKLSIIKNKKYCFKNSTKIK